MARASVLKSLLAACVFSAFAARSVERYTCANSTCFEGECDSTSGTCVASHGCFRTAQEFHAPGAPTKETVLQKGCSVGACMPRTFSATLGNQQLTYRYEQQCCQSEGCNSQDLQLAPPSSKENGVQCPACYNEKDFSCNPVTIKCTGAETKCAEVVGIALNFSGGSHFLLYGKGCATESMCGLENLDILGQMQIHAQCTSGSPGLAAVSSLLAGLSLLMALQ